MQFVWLVNTGVDRQRVEQVAESIASGPMGSQLVSPRMPLARPVWMPSAETGGASIDPAPITAGTELVWADKQLRCDVDVRHTRGWRLSAVPVNDGTSVVSLVVSHALTDGQGMVAAVTAAVRDTAHDAPGRDRPSRFDDICDLVSGGLIDYAKYTAVSVTNLGQNRTPQALLHGFVRHCRSGPLRTNTHRLPTLVTICVGTDELQTATAATGGTATSLSIAITANISRALDGVTNHASIISMPVSHRDPGEATAAVKISYTKVTLPKSNGRYTDLAEIRTRSKQAYAASGNTTPSPHPVDASLSTVGHLPDEYVTAFGSPAITVPRSTTLTAPTAFPRDPSNVSVSTATSTHFTTFAFQSERAHLTDTVLDEFANWNITPTRVADNHPQPNHPKDRPGNR